MKLSKLHSTLLTVSLLGLLAAPTQAVTYYWDVNDNSNGFGTAAGTWAVPTLTGTGWSDSPTGASIIGSITTSTSDTLYFGTDVSTYGLATGTVTVSGAVSAGNITFGSQSGAITLSGGTINLGASSVITTNNSSNTISSVLAGSGAALTKSGAGNLTLSAINTYTGGTVVTGGTLTLGNGGANGVISGSLTINQGATVNANAFNWSLGYGGTRSGANYSGTSVNSIAINGGLLNFTTPISGSGTVTSQIVLTGGTIQGAFGWYNSYTLTPTLQTIASSTRSTIDGISLRLSSSGTLTFDVAKGTTADGDDLHVGGPITNAAGVPDNIGGQVVKTGAGTMVLSGNNTYTGSTTISNGTLQIGTGSNAGSLSPSSAIVNNGVLAFNRSDAITQGTYFASVISGAGSLVKMGAGTLTLNGANTYSGGTTISAGALQIGDGGATGSLSTSGALVNNGVLIVNRSNAVIQGTDFAAAIAGTGSLTKTGAGTLTLNGANSYSGGTTISSGTLQIGDGGTSGSLSTSGAFVNNGALVFNRSNAIAQGTDFTSAAISGSGSLTKAGAGNLTLSAINTYTGGTVVTGGTLTLGNGGPNGVISGSLTINQGTTVNANGNWSLGYGGNRSGATYPGTSVNSIAINGGLLNFTNTSSKNLTVASQIVLTGGTIQGAFDWLNSYTLTPTLQTIASSTRSTINGISLRLSTSGTLSFNVEKGTTSDGIDLYVGGPITDGVADNIGGKVVKTGAGTMFLSGTNTYTGGTIVTGGTLTLGNGGANGVISGSLTINQGATVNASASNNWSLGYGGNRPGATYWGTSVNSIAINGGLLKLSTGAITVASQIVLTGGTIQGAFEWLNSYTLTPTLQTIASSTRSTTDGISLRLSPSGTLTFDVAKGTTADGIDLYVGGPIANGLNDNIGGKVVKTGSGTMVLSGNNTYTGSTTISNGTLQIGANGITGSLSPSSAIVNNSVLAFNRSNAITQGTDFASVISGSGSVVKMGAGTLTLNGIHTYTGPTVVSSGTLAASLNGTMGTGDIAVTGAGAVLGLSGITPASYSVASSQMLTGIGTVALGSKTLNLSGTLAPGNSGVGTLTVAGSGSALAFDNNTKFVFELGTPGVVAESDKVSLTSSATLALGTGAIGMSDFTIVPNSGFGPGVYTLIGGAASFTGSLDSNDLTKIVNGYTGTLGMNGNDLQFTVAIPEPQSWAMLLGGVGLLRLMRNRRSRSLK